jgi:hypothetical protein
MTRAAQRLVIGIALAMVMAVTTNGEAPPAIVFPAVSNNAALQYYQAFITLPALTDEQEKLLDNRATAPLDAAALKLLGDSHASFMFLTRASKLRECDWGLDYSDGANMYLPHLAAARTLARLAALEVRRAFEVGQADRAYEVAFGMVALARQVGGDRTLINMLVSYNIEGMTVGAVAPYLPQVHASYHHAKAVFESLPPSPAITQAVLCEKQMGAWIADQLKKAEIERPGSWRDAWKTMLVGSEHPDPLADAESFDEVVAMTDKFQALYDELAELSALPPQEFDAKYPAFVERAERESPIAKILLPAMGKFVAEQRRSQARMAMLLASIAVVEGGPEKLADIRDPFGDGPFGYRKLDTGFELSSKLQQDGKPVTLVIGQKPTASKP